MSWGVPVSARAGWDWGRHHWHRSYWENDEATAVSTARRAVDAGLTFFDTAPFYGLGESESRLGAALAGRRDGLVLATKVGRLLDVSADGHVEARFDFSADAVRRSLESSLSRLGVDRVDIVHIHDPEDHVDEAIDGAHRALVDLREQGVIGAVSLGTNFVQTAETFLDRGDLDCVLVAGRYTLLDQSAAPVIRQCADARRRLPGGRRVQQRGPRPADGGRVVRLRARLRLRARSGASHRAGLPASRRGVAGGGVELPVHAPRRERRDRRDGERRTRSTRTSRCYAPASPTTFGPSWPTRACSRTTTEEGSE